MYQRRPTIPRKINPGDPITAKFLNGISDLAGYFDGQPFDPTQPLPPLTLGRPTMVKITTRQFTGAAAVAWDDVGGDYLGVKRANYNLGSNGVYAMGDFDYSTTVYPALLIPDFLGNATRSFNIGDYAIGFPISGPNGVVFILQSQPSEILAKITSNSLIAGQIMAWSYTMKPQSPAATNTTWPPLIDKYGSSTFTAYNTLEFNNPSSITGSAQMTGTGVSVSTGVPTCTMKPIGIGAIVRCFTFSALDNSPLYLFTEANSFQ